MHNVHYLLALMRRVRAAIVEDGYPAFLHAYFRKLYGGDTTKIPGWAVTALRSVGVDLLEKLEGSITTTENEGTENDKT